MIEQRGLSGLVAWMAGNPVAANLLMVTLLLGGFLGFADIRQEITPDFSLERVSVSVAYPGASPQEVEEGIVLAIEKELTGMDGIRSITSAANEGSGSVRAELSDDADPGEVLQNVRNAVSRITSFPDDAEPPRVERSQHGFYVISIAIAAQLPPEDLFELSERVRRELLIMPGVSEINLRGRLAPQISIEIGEDRLRALGLTRRQLLTMVLVEAAVVGLVAAVAGVAFGALLGGQILELVSRTINDLYFRVNVTDVSVSAFSIAKGLVAGVGAALLAAAVPALHVLCALAHLAVATPPPIVVEVRPQDLAVHDLHGPQIHHVGDGRGRGGRGSAPGRHR